MAFPLRRTLDPISEPLALDVIKNYLRVDIDDDDSLINSLISTGRERAEDLTSRCLLRQSWTFALDRFPVWYLHSGMSTQFDGIHHPRHRSLFRHDGMEIILPRGPVITVDSIQYIDGTGTPQTLDPTLYFVDNMSEPCRILPAYGRGWPATQWVPNAVTIKFTAGYEQTVTDTLTVPHVAPFTVPVSRASKALSLTSVTDVVASTLVAGCTMTNGIVTFPSGAADKVVSVVYQVSSIPESFLHAIKLILSTYYESRQEVVQGGGNFNTLPLPLSASSLLGTYELFSVGYPHE